MAIVKVNSPKKLLNISLSNCRADTQAYYARVIADGGTIVNLYLINLAFQYAAYLTAVLGRTPLWVTWCDANFGVKKDSSGRVSKLYDLLGLNDFVPIGNITTQPIHTWNSVENTWYLYFDGVNDSLLTANIISWNTNKCTVILVCKTGHNSGWTEYIYRHQGTGNNVIYFNNGNNQTYVGIESVTYYGHNPILTKIILSLIVDLSLGSGVEITPILNNVVTTGWGTGNLGNASGNFTNGNIALMSPYSGFYPNGRIYSCTVLKEALTYSQMKILQDYINTQANLY